VAGPASTVVLSQKRARAFQAKIKGVLTRLQCCFGNLLYKKDGCNLFTNDSAFV